ncbi:hypothetical protein SDJN03_24121, partial [Cucurbita argyrosperma subsp. sororia]
MEKPVHSGEKASTQDNGGREVRLCKFGPRSELEARKRRAFPRYIQPENSCGTWKATEERSFSWKKELSLPIWKKKKSEEIHSPSILLVPLYFVAFIFRF